MCTGMKNTPGKPCCGCTGCVINRIDVTFAQPTAGQPGASIGSWGWDVTTQPTVTKLTQNVLGTTREVCRQTFLAPVETISCSNGLTFTRNEGAWFKYVERFIPASYYADLFFTERWLFDGDLLWRVYAHVDELRLIVDRWGSLARTQLLGTFVLTRSRSFTGRLRQFTGGSCTPYNDITIGVPDSGLPGQFLCARAAVDNPCTLPGGFHGPAFSNVLRNSGYAITMDSGWTTGTCAALPTTPINEPNLFGGYNALASPGTPPDHCRVPSSSTLVMSGINDGVNCSGLPNEYYGHRDNFTPDDVWFARHPFTIS